MPGHYCHYCTAVTFDEDTACLECGEARPAPGWPMLRDSMDPWLGRVLTGRYLLTKSIGQGASASVYRAESLAISRQFAIKIIHPAKSANGPSPEQIAARLEREIEALGRLRNPHVVRFYDVIELPLHHIGVVMDFVEGDTLEQAVLSQGPLSPQRAASLLRQMANGIYEAHLAQMTHRDLKPENLMVERLPAGDEFVHVLDFGIVTMNDSASVTQGFIGTPLYASPEQAMGEGVDHRSDIYSLGAILFFMLTGRPPFTGTNVLQVLRQHVEHRPPRIADYRRDVAIPDELESLVQQMLSKDPADRPQSLAEVIKQLDQLAMQEGRSGVFQAWAREPSGSTALGGPARRDDMSHTAPDAPSSAAFRPFRTDPALGTQQPSSARLRAPRELRQSSALTSSAELTRKSELSEPTRPGTPGLSEIVLEQGVKPGAFSGTPELRLAFVQDARVRLHTLTEGPIGRSFSFPSAPPVSVAALGLNALLLGREDGAIGRLDLATGQHHVLFQSVFSDAVTGVDLSPDARLMLAVMASGRLYMSAAAKDERDWVRLRQGAPATCIKLSPKQDLFAIGREDRTVDIARVAEPKQARLSFKLPDVPRRLAFSEDGYLLCVLFDDQSLGLYQVINGMNLLTMDRIAGAHLLDVFFSVKLNTIMGYILQDGVLHARTLQPTGR